MKEIATILVIYYIIQIKIVESGKLCSSVSMSAVVESSITIFSKHRTIEKRTIYHVKHD